MTLRATRPTPCSPLDPFLEPFLRHLDERTEGYAPAAHGVAAAAALGWPPAFVEAVFVSARARGLLEPYRDRGARGRARWALSARGRAWVEREAEDVGADPARIVPDGAATAGS